MQITKFDLLIIRIVKQPSNEGFAGSRPAEDDFFFLNLNGTSLHRALWNRSPTTWCGQNIDAMGVKLTIFSISLVCVHFYMMLKKHCLSNKKKNKITFTDNISVFDL